MLPGKPKQDVLNAVDNNRRLEPRDARRNSYRYKEFSGIKIDGITRSDCHIPVLGHTILPDTPCRPPDAPMVEALSMTAGAIQSASTVTARKI